MHIIWLFWPGFNLAELFTKVKLTCHFKEITDNIVADDKIQDKIICENIWTRGL